MKNLDWCVYTYKHRIAFRHVVKKLCREPEVYSEMMKRADVHDMDKMLMYQFLDQNTAQLHHVRTKPHHLESGLGKSDMDLLETVIDYECAPYTKPDKPLNAYDFTLKLMDMNVLDRTRGDRLISIMHRLGIDRSCSITETDEWKSFTQSLPVITEDMIKLQLVKYINENECPEIKFIEEQTEQKGESHE